MTDWRVIRSGAIGAELSLCGFGWGRDLFHAYVRLGVITVYVASQRLDRVLAAWKAAREHLTSILDQRAGNGPSASGGQILGFGESACSRIDEREHGVSQKMKMDVSGTAGAAEANGDSRRNGQPGDDR